MSSTRQAVGHNNEQRRRFPSLVSFVGETGAGKSSIIELLIDLDSTAGHSFASPVIGAAGSDTPTSDNVHLYLDPRTVRTRCPQLYADTEGLKGGEREPVAAKHKKRSKSRTRTDADSASNTEAPPGPPPRRYTNRRDLLWTNTAKTQSREYAVTNLYPRLLYTFSDVIVFILKNSRTIEDVFERLIVWAATALEKSSNQPMLPHAIIVLNALPIDNPAKLWETEPSTGEILHRLARTVHRTPVFKDYAKFWRDRNRVIESAEDLILSYYSSIKIVRVPTPERPSLVALQVAKLQKTIGTACSIARENKVRLRMLLDEDELDLYLQYAFDHFAQTLDTAFDFVQASFANSRFLIASAGTSSSWQST